MMKMLFLLLLVLMPRMTLAGETKRPEMAAVTSATGTDPLSGIVTCDNPQKIVVVTCPRYGVIGNGINNDTDALQKAIDNAPEFSTIVLPAAVAIRVTDTITIYNRRGLRIVGGGSVGQTANEGASRIIYDGANDKPVIQIRDSRDLTFRDFTVMGNSKANAAIQAVMTGAGQATTFNRFHGMAFNSGSKPRTNWIGLDICSTEKSENCEKFVISESVFQSGSGTNTRGIVIGHTNALTETIQDCVFNGHSIAIQNLNGSMAVMNNLFDGNKIDIASVGPDPIIIQFNRTEGAKQFFKALGGGTQIVMVGNRFGSSDSNPGIWIDLSGTGSGSTLTFMNNVFSGEPFTRVTPFVGGAGQLFSTGNVYDPRQVRNGQIPSMDTFHSGYTSLNDSGVRNILSTGQARSVSGRNPVYLLHLEDYFGVLHSTGMKYKFFGSDASANLFFGDTARPLILDGSAVSVTSLKAKGSAGNKKVVCVDTATGRLYASSTGTDCSD
jgi:hypothetical protein